MPAAGAGLEGLRGFPGRGASAQDPSAPGARALGLPNPSPTSETRPRRLPAGTLKPSAEGPSPGLAASNWLGIRPLGPRPLGDVLGGSAVLCPNLWARLRVAGLGTGRTAKATRRSQAALVCPQRSLEHPPPPAPAWSKPAGEGQLGMRSGRTARPAASPGDPGLPAGCCWVQGPCFEASKHCARPQGVPDSRPPPGVLSEFLPPARAVTCARGSVPPSPAPPLKTFCRENMSATKRNEVPEFT